MKKFIIGIAGKAGSGKDTIASMISYIVDRGVWDANYEQWKRLDKSIIKNEKIIHFANPLKDCLSIMYNIPREYFDNREYKENLYYSLDEHKFIKENDLLTSHKVVTIGGLHYNNLPTHKILFPNKQLVIKLRDLMQYFGTELCRQQLDNNIWINCVMSKAKDIVNNYGYCIIPDVRFINEASAITNSYLYGGLIKVNRDVEQISHESEKINFNCDYEIDNNGNIEHLFNQVLNITNKIIKK